MKFGSKHIFNTLFILSGLVAIWVGALFTSKLVMYMKFSNYTQGKAVHWGVISLDEERHRVCVDYTFSVGEKAYAAQHMFVKPTYKNREAATFAMEGKESESVNVWYMAGRGGKDPLSIVERQFPMNELLRFSVVMSVLGYFYFLKSYLYRFSIGEEGREMSPQRGGRSLKPGKETL